MRQLTDKEVLEQAKSYEWDRYVITLAGKAKRYGLIFVRQYDQPYEDVQFCTIDRDPAEMGAYLQENWERNKTPLEPLIKYVRFVEIPGLGGQHIMIRLAASSADGELFKCANCGCIRTGYADLARGSVWSPYSLHVPQITEDRRHSRRHAAQVQAWRDFIAPCTTNP